MDILNFVKSKVFLKQVVIALIALGVFVFLVSTWLTITTNHDQKIQVPNLEKMTMEEVQKVLEEYDLNSVIIDSASFNPSYPKNSVIDQDPVAGSFVKEKRKIYITLNPSGYRNVEVPDMYGKTKRQATSQLRSLGFRVDTTYYYVTDIAKDVVRGLKWNGKVLKDGDNIPKTSLIKLQLGDGKGFEPYKKVE